MTDTDRKTSSIELLRKLECYEASAYSGGFGHDWLADVGEGFKFYVQECVMDKKEPTINGFEQYIDKQLADSDMKEAFK